jgi:hypothetical protein
MKKRKVKKFQEGGVLRDGYGNPVRSGSGEVVRTRFPERTYNEQSTADMTESSDYSGRRMKSPDDEGSSAYAPSGRAPDIEGKGSDDERRTIDRYIKRSTDESSPKADAEEKKTVTRKPVKKVRKVDDKPVGRMNESSDYSGGRKSAPAAPKSKFSDTGKSVRLNALLKSIPLNPFGLKKGGTVSSASSRADGIAQRGKTKGRIC